MEVRSDNKIFVFHQNNEFNWFSSSSIRTSWKKMQKVRKNQIVLWGAMNWKFIHKVILISYTFVPNFNFLPKTIFWQKIILSPTPTKIFTFSYNLLLYLQRINLNVEKIKRKWRIKKIVSVINRMFRGWWTKRSYVFLKGSLIL